MNEAEKCLVWLASRTRRPRFRRRGAQFARSLTGNISSIVWLTRCSAAGNPRDGFCSRLGPGFTGSEYSRLGSVGSIGDALHGGRESCS